MAQPKIVYQDISPEPGRTVKLKAHPPIILRRQTILNMTTQHILRPLVSLTGFCWMAVLSCSQTPRKAQNTNGDFGAM